MQRCTKRTTLSLGAVSMGLIVAGLAVVGCSGDDGVAGAAGPAGRSSLARVDPEPSGPNCPTGGQAIRSGVDTNANGTLDESEVTSTEYVCNAPDGDSALVVTRDEAAGDNCATGGIAVDSGIDTNGNGELDSDEVTSTSYVCNGAGSPDGGAPDSGEDAPPDATEASPDVADSASEGGECVVDTDCPTGFACFGSYCVRSCNEASDCPTGYFCDSTEQCLKKDCETSADCTDGTHTECDPAIFRCVKPVAAVAPTIAGFRASPPAAVLGQPTPITFVWDMGATPAYPEATCSINNGIGAVAGTSAVRPVTISSLPKTFTLTCTNGAGSATANVIIPGLLSTLVSIEVSPAGGTYQFGPASLVLPAGAVKEPTTISAQLSTKFTPSPDLVSLPVEFYPDGFTFLQPVTLTLPINTALLQPAGWNVAMDDLHVAVTGDDEWQVRIFTDVDSANQTLTAQIGHFSSAAGSASAAGSCSAPPISVPKKSLVRRDEIMRLGGVDWTAFDVYGQVYDDLKQTDRERMADVLDPLGTDLDEGVMRAAATADFDGDTRDEVVVATQYKVSNSVGAVRLTVLDSCHSSAEAGDCWNDFTALTSIDIDPTSSGKSINDVSVGAGDLDGDGLAEIAVVVSFEGGGGALYRYDDADHSYAKLALGDLLGALGGMADLRIAVGDLNHNLTDNTAEEIAIAGTYINYSPHLSALYVLPDGMSSLVVTPKEQIQNGFGNIFPPYNHSRPNVAVADIDNDGDGEVVIAAIDRMGFGELFVEAYKLRSDQHSFMKVGDAYYRAPQGWDNDMSPLIVGVDVNGDGKSEVAIVERENCCEARMMLFALGAAATPWGKTLLWEDARSNGDHYLAKGDVDGDLKEDVVVAELRRDQGDYDVAVLGLNGSNALGYKKGWRPRAGQHEWAPVLAVGDFDGDSLALAYTGECTSTTTEIRPLVAMAAPPVGLSLEQNREDSSTEYGTSTQTSNSQSSAVSNRDSVTLSLSASFMGDLFETSASASLEREFTRTSTNTTSLTLGQSFSAPWLDDSYHNYVLYVTSEYVSYKYEIIGASNAQALTDANKFMTIDVPHGTNQYATTMETYNSKAPSSRQIGNETFAHTLGDTSTYRSFVQCDDLIYGRGWKSADQWVAEIGSQTVSIEMAKEQASAEERTESVDLETGVSIGGVGLSYGRGYSSSSAYEISVGDSTEYVGTVGGLMSSPPGNWDNNKYKFRMVVYNLKRNNSLAYTVIDYCVEH